MGDQELHDENKGGPWQEDAAGAQQVRTALRRVDAPDGFTERVMARAEVRGGAAPSAREHAGGRGALLQFTRPAWRLTYAAAAVLAVAGGTLRVEHMRAEQRRAAVAAAQFDTALQVTHHALDHVSAELETTQFGEVQRALEANGKANGGSR